MTHEEEDYEEEVEEKEETTQQEETTQTTLFGGGWKQPNKKKPEKVVITVEGGEFSYSVNFQARIYGASHPCGNEEEIQKAIESCKNWIKGQGDTPIVEDKRIKLMMVEEAV